MRTCGADTDQPVLRRPPALRGESLYLVVAVVIPVAYAVYLLTRLAGVDVGEVAFVRPLLIALGASIAANALLGGAGGDRRTDARDRDITRHGEYVGFFVLAWGMLPAFVLALLEADHFWIAHAMYAAYVLNAITSSTVKLVAYRRGL